MIKTNFITTVKIDVWHQRIRIQRFHNEQDKLYNYWDLTHRVSFHRFSRQNFDRKVVALLNIAFRNGFEVSFDDDPYYFPKIVICNVPQNVV